MSFVGLFFAGSLPQLFHRILDSARLAVAAESSDASSSSLDNGGDSCGAELVILVDCLSVSGFRLCQGIRTVSFQCFPEPSLLYKQTECTYGVEWSQPYELV